MFEVDVAPLPIDRFGRVVDDATVRALGQVAEAGQALLADRTLWCVNSTARGGGVAELLVPLLGYTKGAGIEARWMVIEGDAPFFEVTKRLHHRLHGGAGDGGPLGPEEREAYASVTRREGEALAAMVAPQDLVLLHDPQTAGMAPVIEATGAKVVWRLHVGTDEPNDLAREAWEFLGEHLAGVDAYVVSRREFAWPQMDEDRLHVINPSIDPLSPKNQPIDADTVRAILVRIGLLEGTPDGDPQVTSADGTPIAVTHEAVIAQEGPVPADAPLVTQVSRWDPLKDPAGVLSGFAERVDRLDGAHLALAGPDVAAVADDPEAAAILEKVEELWRTLPDEVRRRIHLVSLPMEDLVENAVMVNAIQRYSMVIVQKSLAEGFGLTVAEAMWKDRPVIASGVGGILEQVIDGENGIILRNARDLDAYGDALQSLLTDVDLAHAMGHKAHERVLERFLEPRHLGDWLVIVRELLHGEG